jgi:signal recognition particle subunit SEC65
MSAHEATVLWPLYFDYRRREQERQAEQQQQRRGRR